MTLFVDGSFRGHTGKLLSFKIECDALTDKDIRVFAALIARTFTFREVYGVPRGGLRLAEALSPHRSDLGIILVVDDVYTTGMSMEEFRKNLHIPPTDEVLGVVMFARGKCPEWIRPVLQLSECFWG